MTTPDLQVGSQSGPQIGGQFLRDLLLFRVPQETIQRLVQGPVPMLGATWKKAAQRCKVSVEEGARCTDPRGGS